ncbi:MAG: hypothetical protein LBT66_09205 [Methanobrevibacter sp.]|nr:hypothetical protein [Candidatus Methanovirga meridionalis]
MQKIINDIWNKNEFENIESTESIINHLDSYKRGFKKKIIKFKRDCYNQLNYHERPTHYSSEEKKLKDCIHGDDNLDKIGGDMNICLDAHDLAKKSNINKLLFITDDNDLYDCKHLLKTHTKIHEVKHLLDC